MAKDNAIELQQPADFSDGPFGVSDAVKNEVAEHHGNSHDMADMDRLGKKQRLDVRLVAAYDVRSPS